jgi:hypothetical protein
MILFILELTSDFETVRPSLHRTQSMGQRRD